MGVGPLNVGLATGIDFNSIIEGLISIEQRPVQNLQTKIEINNLRQQALDQLNGLALTAKLSMFDLSSSSTFDQKVASSSNESILTATASTAANIGNHVMQVVQRAQFGQSLSDGVSDQSTTAIGRGNLIFEMGTKRLDQATSLDVLNDGEGVERGKVLFTDQTTGNTESIDLTNVIDMKMALDQLNDNNMGMLFEVNRSFSSGSFTGSGVSIKVTNNGPNSVKISQEDTASTVVDLGLPTTTIASAGNATGTQILKVSEKTSLNRINDGFGIETNASGTKDIRFYVEDNSTVKHSIEVDLHGSSDIGDVLNKINLELQKENLDNVAKAKLSSDGLRIEFEGTITKVQDINGSRAAYDLGLTELTNVTGGVQGGLLVAELNSSLIRNLHGGQGLASQDGGVIKVVSKSENSYFMFLNNADSVQDILRVFNGTLDLESGTLTEISAEINANGNGFVIKDTASSGTGAFYVEDYAGTLAEELGIKSVEFNFKANDNAYDVVNATSVSQDSTLFVDKNDIPEGVTENDLVGRYIRHKFGSQITGDPDDGTNSSNESPGVEFAKIIAYEAASDDVLVSAVEAKSASATLANSLADSDGEGDNDDLLTDATNLDATKNTDLDTANLVGATLTVYTNSGSFSSTITNYDSTTKAIRLKDNVISTGIGSGNAVQSYGYTISYNHKIVLAHPDPTEVGANTATLTAGPPDVITDTTNFVSNSPAGIDYTRLIGATFTAEKDDGTKYSAVVADFDKGANTIDLTGTTISANVTQLELQSNGYKITYKPIMHAQPDDGSNLTKLDLGTNDADFISVLGDADGVIDGGNVENRSISVNTALTELNGGSGIFKGSVRVTASGSAAEIDLSQESLITVQDLIDEFNDKLSSVRLEVNDRGDGLRIYDITSDQSTTSGLAVSEVNNGTTAEDLRLKGEINNSQQTTVTRTTDFASYSGANINTNNISQIQIAELAGLDRQDVIGSLVQYTDSATSKIVSGIVRQYKTVSVGGNLVGEIDITGAVLSDGTAIPVVSNSADAQTINVFLKEDLNFSRQLASSGQVSGFSETNRTGNIQLDPNDALLESYTEEELVGSFIRFNSSGFNDADHPGQVALITNYDAGASLLTFLAPDPYTTPAILFASEIYIATDHGNKNNIDGGGQTTASSYLRDLAGNGFSTFTAEVDEGTSNTVIFSDDFANRDPLKMKGALVTITDATDSARNKDIAVVKDYDAKTRTITIDAFYDSSGAKEPTTFKLSEGDKVSITYKDELEGAVLRSTSPSSITVSDANATVMVSAALASTREIRVDSITDATEGTNGSLDKLIGSTITFTSTTPTAALQDQSRTIVDVVEDYGGVQGRRALVLDEDLPSAVAVTDDFTITFPEIIATIEDIDFFSGKITTRDEMDASMGNRSFNIHPVIDGSSQVEVEIESTDTLNDIVNAVNLANVGVKATVVNDGSGTDPFRLSFDSEESGSKASVTVDSTIRGFNTKTVRQGEDAKVILGGDSGFSSVITSRQNTITDAITGLTIDLKSESSEKVTIDIKHDTEGITEKANDFLESVNNLLNAARQVTAHEIEVEVQNDDGTTSTEKQQGVLFNNFAANQLLDTVKNIFTKRVDGVASGEFTLLSDVGFKLDTNGELVEFDSSLFEQNLTSRFDQVKNLFTVSPNIASQSGVNAGTNFVQSGFDIKDITNGKSSSSGFSENGNGTNGIKVQTGLANKYITFELGQEKTLQGMKLFHHVPSDLTATYSVSADRATSGSASLKSEITGIAANGFTSDGLVQIGAVSKGTDGNQISLIFDGVSTVNQIISDHNTANPDNTVSLLAGAGGSVPTAQTVNLTGGQDGVDVLTDTNLGSNFNLIKKQLIGATLQVDTGSSVLTSTISDYDEASGSITLEDNAVRDGLASDTDIQTYGYSIVSPSGENLSYSYNPVLEYRDPVTGEFKVYREFSDISRDRLFVVFSGGLTTDAVRIRYNENSGDSVDFTSDGHFARLMEVEIEDGQGLGTQINRSFDSLTNAQTGLITSANATFAELNASFNSRISRLEEQIENSRQSLIRQFANLELVVSTLTSQSNFVQSQLGSLPTAFSHRKG